MMTTTTAHAGTIEYALERAHVLLAEYDDALRAEVGEWTGRSVAHRYGAMAYVLEMIVTAVEAERADS